MHSAASVRIERDWAVVDGLHVHFLRAQPLFLKSSAVDGTATVVLIHGLGMSGRYFRPLIRQLASQCRVLAPDLPGFGASQKPSSSISIELFSRSLAQWFEATASTRATWIGNSMGCQIAIDLATRRPDIVERLILLGPTVDAARRKLAQQACRLLMQVSFEPWSLFSYIASDYFRAGPLQMFHSLKACLSDAPEIKARAIACPVLVVRGSHDRVATHNWSEHLASQFQDGTLEVVPGGSHAVHYSHPRRVAELTISFMSRQDRQPSH